MRIITLMLAILAIPCAAQAADTLPAPKSSISTSPQIAAGAGANTGLQAGLDAYQSGDYPVALKELTPLANKGDATAQLRLGEMNEMGKGVRRNYPRALVRYRQAAEQGNTEAQAKVKALEARVHATEPQHYVVKAATPAALAAGVAALPDPSNSKQVIQDTQAKDIQATDIRQKTKLATSLPGVGKLSGSSAVFNASVIRVSAERNEVVYVSHDYPNRISTPFRHPMLVGALPEGYNDDTIKIVGSSIYFPAVDKSLAVFITGNDPGDQVVSLTLMPKDIPAQTVSLMLDGGESASTDRKTDAAPGSYTEALVAKFRLIAVGKVPQGFSSAKMPPTIGRAGALIIIPEERYSGQKLDIYRYRVENSRKGVVELAETSFYENGVRGVAIYPNLKLDAGETTYVFVAADKGSSDAGVAEPMPLAAGE